MPIKRLTEKQEDNILDIIDDHVEGFQSFDNRYDMIDDLNHLFAKIYGYKKGTRPVRRMAPQYERFKQKPKRKLSAWNKFVKANSNKKKFQYASGKLKLKKMGIAYRKKRR